MTCGCPKDAELRHDFILLFCLFNNFQELSWSLVWFLYVWEFASLISLWVHDFNFCFGVLPLLDLCGKSGVIWFVGSTLFGVLRSWLWLSDVIDPWASYTLSQFMVWGSVLTWSPVTRSLTVLLICVIVQFSISSDEWLKSTHYFAISDALLEYFYI